MSDPTGATAGALYVPGFQANLNLSPQQTRSRLLQAVDSDLAYATKGTFFNVDDVGTADPADVTARVPDSPDGFVDLTRRFGAFKGFADGRYIDSEDLTRELEDPTSRTMQAMMAGLARKRDVAIIQGIAGPYQYQDQNQNYLTGAPNANVIASNDSTAHEAENIAAVQNQATGGYGLTLGKLIDAKMNLDNAEIDEATPGDAPSNYYYACTANQIRDLMLSVPATSNFYNDVRALNAGTISYFFGFNFIRLPTAPAYNPLPKVNYTRKTYAWIKQAVSYRGRTIENTQVARRADKSFRWYAYYESEHGAVRRYDGGVYEVDCDERTQSYT